MSMQGSIQKRGKSSWRIEISTGRQPDGTYGRVRETVKGTKAQAELRLAELLVELNRNEYIVSSKAKLSDYLKQWMKFVEAERSPNTKEFYQNMIDYYIAKDSIYDLRLDELTKPAIKEFLLKVSNNTSYSTACKVKATLSSALSVAVEDKMLRHNPCAKIGFSQSKDEPVKKSDVWTEDEIARVLEVASNVKNGIYFWLALETGMRQNEILALKWSVIDLDNHSITIDSAIKQRRTKNPKIGLPKTKSSIRKVSVSSFLTNELKKHKVQQNEKRLKIGKAYINNGLVLADDYGRPLDSDNIRKRLMPKVCGLAKVPYIPPRNLRHCHASWLLAQEGISIKMIQERLGHAKASTTMNKYILVAPDLENRPTQKIEEFHIKQNTR